MSAEFGCTEMRELAAELALGIASGDERARALEHVARCGDCRTHLAQLTSVADDLLLLAPEAEPPPGFESRVLQRTSPGPARGRRGRLLALVGVAAATAAATALVAVAAFHDDHRLASDYRAALAHGHGASFKAVPLRGAGGIRAGQVFAYEGTPSWVFVTVNRGERSRGYRCVLVKRDGRRIEMYAFAPDARTGSWGGATPVPLSEVRAVEVSGGEDGEVLVARLAPD